MTRISDERPKQALKTDVPVVVGGAAGLAAACTAAKAGARVLLLEKYGFCGGPRSRVSRAPFAGCSRRRTTERRRPSESSTDPPIVSSIS
jgi:NADPH-dependent 2,4-dienoyl-CoA reductase/sulfur reductase-like enzyme